MEIYDVVSTLLHVCSFLTAVITGMLYQSNRTFCLRAYTTLTLTHSNSNIRLAIAEMAAQCCTSQIFFEWGFLTFMHCISVISENIAISHILLKTRFFGLHFC